MTDVDRLDLLARIGICFKIGAEGSFGVAAQGKGSDVCSCKEFLKFCATADSHCYLTCVKKGILRQHTTFTSCPNATCSNEMFSLSGRLCFGPRKRLD